MVDPHWIAAGEILRTAYRRMVRRRRQGEPVEDFPYHIDWPPRVGSGTAPPGPSRPIRELLQWLDVERALKELYFLDKDAYDAVDLVDRQGRTFNVAEAKLGLTRRAIQDVLHDRGWAFIAERVLKVETEN